MTPCPQLWYCQVMPSCHRWWRLVPSANTTFGSTTSIQSGPWSQIRICFSYGPLNLTKPGTIKPISVSWPPNLNVSAQSLHSLKTPRHCLYALLSLRVTGDPNTVGARAAWTKSKIPMKSKKSIAANDASKFMTGSKDLAMLYISPDPYYGAFEEESDLRKFDFASHWTAGLCFLQKDNWLIMASMKTGTPSAHVDKWQMCVWGAWILEINGTRISTILDAQAVFCCLLDANAKSCTLLLSHPEVSPDISNEGLPIMPKSNLSQFTHEQLNNCVDLLEESLRVLRTHQYDIIQSDQVHNYVTQVMWLMQEKLLQQDDWLEWQNLEYL